MSKNNVTTIIKINLFPPRGAGQAGKQAGGQWSRQRTADGADHRNGLVITGKGKYTIHCLTVIGQVEGYILPAQNKTTKYEHVIPSSWRLRRSRP